MPSIKRRDFLGGTALAIAAGLTPAAQIAAAPALYPPALTGMRGQHPGSFEVAHAFAREGRPFGIDDTPSEETYDLVVVGGGISGLAAAWFYRRAVGAGARILILDNHDDFGGHAKRNEFSSSARTLIGYGGSQSIQSPKTLWSDVAKGLLRDLGVEISRFDSAFDRGFYASLGLSRGVFFDRETFGRDALVTGDALLSRGAEGGPQLGDFIASMPIADASKQQLLLLYDPARDSLAGKSAEEKAKILKTTSYRDYLVKICGCSNEVANCFQGRPLGFFGLGCDAVSAFDLRGFGYPGFAGLKLPADDHPESNEPYIYHFPDGNASLARLLVRALVAAAAPGRTMDDIVLAGFDYGALDRADNNVRLRLQSTVIDVRQRGDGVSIGYVNAGAPHRVTAKYAVLACFHLFDAGTAAGAARGAGAQCQDAAGLHQCRRTQLAALARAQGLRHLPRRWASSAMSRSTFRSTSAVTGIRAIRRSRSSCTSSTSPAHRTPASMRARNFTSARPSSWP